MTEEGKTPVNLTPDFDIVSYDGAEESDINSYKHSKNTAYHVRNILNTKPDFHCSKNGRNFDLVLKYLKGDFTMSNFSVFGPRRCTAPVQHLAVFVSSTKPELEKYADKFNGCLNEVQFKKVLGELKMADTHCFFLETDKILLQGEIALPKGISGSFIHLKFIKPHGADVNIDIARIGIVGVAGANVKFKALPEIPLTMNLTRKKKEKFCSFAEENEPWLYLSKQDSVVLFSEDSTAIDALKKIALCGDYDKTFQFFYSDFKMKFGVRVREFASVDGTDSQLIILSKENDKFKCPKVKLTESYIKGFLKDYADGKISKYLKSAPRPENDADPDHPGITVLVTSTFEKIALDPSKDVFVDLYADWCGPCVALKPILCDVGYAMKDEKDILIAKYDSQANDKDSKYFPESHIPVLKFFPKDKKSEPVSCKVRTGEGIIKFIHSNGGIKFDLKEKIEIINKLEELRFVKNEIKKIRKKISQDLKDSDGKFDDTKKPQIDDIIKTIHDKLQLTDKIVLEEYLVELKKLVKSPLLEELKKVAEKAILKNVIKIHTEAEFNEQIKVGKSVVDFFATWCGPCVRIAPIFAELSEKYPAVKFLKIDVDKLSSVSKSCGIKAMPTFQFYKDGKKVEEFSGASKQKLEEHIKKL